MTMNFLNATINQLNHNYPTFSALPSPPDPTLGVEGMRIAHRVLQRYKAAGLLIGDSVKAIWNLARAHELSHYVVNVLLLQIDCARHPDKFESGINWWVSHRINQNPTNGMARTGIVFRAHFRPGLRAPSGLYIPSDEIVLKNHQKELGYISEGRPPDLILPQAASNEVLDYSDFFCLGGGSWKKRTALPAFREFRVMPIDALVCAWRLDPIAIYCD